MSFSDTEKVVGEWFGVPLYSKTFYIQSLPNNSDIRIPIAPVLSKNIRKLEGIGYSVDGVFQLDFYHPSKEYGVVLQVFNGNLQIVTYNDKSQASAYVTIYYVK